MMIKARWLNLLALLAVLASVGCTGLPAGPAASGQMVKSDKERVSPPDELGDDLAALVEGNSSFAFDLYQALAQEQDGNLFYSPYSISLALAMTYAGSRGETETQMAETLHYTLPQAQLHAAFNGLDHLLTSLDTADADDADGFQINIANAIWGQAGFEFLTSFLDTLAQNYGAGLRTVDFAQNVEAARKTINDWVSRQTEEKIQDLIPQGMLSDAARLVLTNAIYFNGKWALPFPKEGTRDDAFNLLDGSAVTVPMMTQTEQIPYAAGSGYQAAALPYRGTDMSMVLVLPDSDRFAEIEGALSTEFLASLVSDLEWERVRITLPKFTFASSFRLSKSLSDLGMPSAFHDADFSGMTGKRDLFISDVVHKAFVAVDEEGTEAAAATAVIMELTAIMGEEPIEMRLDRPFLFLIRDNHTGTILFIGRMMNPEG